jgi:hypothetical protein
VQWKILVLDEAARRIIDSSVKEDDILNHNIASMLLCPAHEGCAALSENPRHRADRGAEAAEPGNGCHLHPLAAAAHCRLPAR